jgi:hypothetical protein
MGQKSKILLIGYFSRTIEARMMKRAPNQTSFNSISNFDAFVAIRAIEMV